MILLYCFLKRSFIPSWKYFCRRAFSKSVTNSIYITGIARVFFEEIMWYCWMVFFFFPYCFRHDRCILTDLAKAGWFRNVSLKIKLLFLFNELIKLCESQWFTKFSLKLSFWTFKTSKASRKFQEKLQFYNKNIWKYKTVGRNLVQMSCIYQNHSLQYQVTFSVIQLLSSNISNFPSQVFI